MRAKHYCGVVLAAGLTCGIGADLPGAFGIGEAAAAEQTRVYTRKRVNGRWITGRFVAKVEPVARAGTQVKAPASPTPPERFAALQMDSAEKGRDTSVSTTADAGERRGLLQRALETRAQELAHLPPAAESGAVQPRSVSFDFETGLKTTIYPDDRVVREGFDLAAAKALASKPPESTGLQIPKP